MRKHKEVKAMDRNFAIEILKAMACCSITGLRCDECPFYVEDPELERGAECRSWTDAEVIEAVRVLNGESGHE